MINQQIRFCCCVMVVGVIVRDNIYSNRLTFNNCLLDDAIGRSLALRGQPSAGAARAALALASAPGWGLKSD